MMIPGAFLTPAAAPRLSNHEAEHAGSPGTVSWTFRSDGVLRKTEGGVTTDIALEWFSDVIGGIGASYDVRCSSINSGPGFTAEAAVVGTYTQVNADRTWTLTATFPRQIVATFQIVATGDTTVLAEGDLTFLADGTN